MTGFVLGLPTIGNSFILYVSILWLFELSFLAATHENPKAEASNACTTQGYWLGISGNLGYETRR